MGDAMPAKFLMFSESYIAELVRTCIAQYRKCSALYCSVPESLYALALVSPNTVYICKMQPLCSVGKLDH